MTLVTEVIDRDLGWNKIVRETKIADNSFTKVGLFGTGGDESSNLAARMAVHEFGSRNGNIPKRPYNRQAFDNNEKSLVTLVKNSYARILEGKINATRALQLIGEWFAGKVREEITGGSFFPLKPSTIAAKGSSQPLIDTGQVRREITHKEEIKR